MKKRLDTRCWERICGRKRGPGARCGLRSPGTWWVERRFLASCGGRSDSTSCGKRSLGTRCRERRLVTRC